MSTRQIVLTALLLSAVVLLVEPASAQKVRLRSQITPTCPEVRSGAGSGIRFSDLYADGGIAVQGSYNCNGAFIYDISNPDSPVVASWYNPGNNQQFLEAIVIGNRGYFGSGTGNGGVHIVDLTNPYAPVTLGTVDAIHGGGHPTIHEMMVFDQNGQRYLLENSNLTSTTSLKIINITDPANPVLKWTFSPGGWIHAMHLRGTRLFLSGFFSSTRVDIYDLSNLANQAPVSLGAVQVGSGSNHSTWSNETGEYLYSARELLDGDLRVYDVRNPAQPLLVRSIKAGDLGLNAITPHNPVVMGNRLYVSWYQAGLQVFDISDPANPIRIGQYDTFPAQFAPTADEIQKIQSLDPWDMYCGAANLRDSALPTNYDGAWAVYPFLGEDKVLVGDVRTGLVIVDVTKAAQPAKNLVSDFDGDGKTDLSVFRPSVGDWSVEMSSDSSPFGLHWGVSEDIPAAGDYDGDGKSDLAVFRPSTGIWWIYYSATGTSSATKFGQFGDIPVTADYDADGKMDIGVFRPSTGVWYIFRSSLGIAIVRWGQEGDKPLVGDYEGDGKPDFAVWRPSNGVWYVLQSSSSIPLYISWGMNGDKPVWADFDGDGRSDFTVYRPSTGTWWIFRPDNNSFLTYRFGMDIDIPTPADFDGDGKADIAVFRPTTNEWYRINSIDGSIGYRVFGQSGDRSSPASVQPQ